MSKINPHLSREEKIALLQRIAAGLAKPEDLKEKELVFYAYEGPTPGSPPGLYADGKPTDNPVDLAAWKHAFKNCQIKVVYGDHDEDGNPCEYDPDASTEKQTENDNF